MSDTNAPDVRKIDRKELASGLLLILALFGIIHAVRTPRTTAFAAPEIADRRSDRQTVGV